MFSSWKVYIDAKAALVGDIHEKSSVKFERNSKVSNEAYFFATVLFQVMQQSAGVDEPENGGVEIFVSLFNEPANSVDSGCQERLDLLVVVDVISVADAHEDNVGRKSR